MKLYELTEELEQLQSMLIESGGEITEELEELMSRNEAAVKDKMKGYIMVIKELKAREQAALEEKRRLDTISKKAGRAADRLKSYILHHMEVMDVRSVDTDLGKVYVARASKGKLVINKPVEELPPSFAKYVKEPDKDAIKAALDSGRDISDIAYYEEPSKHIRIS